LCRYIEDKLAAMDEALSAAKSDALGSKKVAEETSKALGKVEKEVEKLKRAGGTGDAAAGLALFMLFCSSNHHFDDTQYDPCNKSYTPRE
jgi:hypothetical protein